MKQKNKEKRRDIRIQDWQKMVDRLTRERGSSYNPLQHHRPGTWKS